MSTIVKNFMNDTPPKWRVVRNACLFIVGILSVIINAGNQVPELGISAPVVAWMNLVSGLFSFVALFAQGQSSDKKEEETN